MKSLYIILSVFLSFQVLKGQNAIFDLVSEGEISVKNNNNFSTRILVYDNGRTILDIVLQPGNSSSFPYEYSKSDVQKIRFKEVYDDQALELDFDRIEAIKRARDEQRATDGTWKAIVMFFDEVVFGGTFSTLFEIGSYGVMYFNGATEEEWANALKDSAIGFGIDNSFDKNYQKGLASAAYELAKSLQPKEYKDLQDALVFFMRKRESQYMRSGYITDTAKLPRRRGIKYPYFSIGATYPINQKFAEDALQEGVELYAVKSEPFNDQYPFEVRLSFRNGPMMGYFFEYGKTNVFKNLNSPDFQYLKPNNAFRFTTYSLGISPSYAYLELGLGLTYLQQENYIIENTANQLNPIERTNKWGGFIEPKVNIRLTNPIAITGSWKATIFGDKNIEETLFEFYSFKVGIGINFNRRELDFSN